MVGDGKEDGIPGLVKWMGAEVWRETDENEDRRDGDGDAEGEERDDEPATGTRKLDGPHHWNGNDDEKEVSDDIGDAKGGVEGVLADASIEGEVPGMRKGALEGDSKDESERPEEDSSKENVACAEDEASRLNMDDEESNGGFGESQRRNHKDLTGIVVLLNLMSAF